ncbi:flagellar motor stator protein MotA [Chitinasiproducens palmae]|uniref:Chemotaxis protein MotA n=1 Tax=Chitinasiproducens palmae TaxID=1770053 RepID=A0A1H2PLK7_9BURK|nr:flagellar motor stator protein MotA [Chitinasiproducens palmae]SDV46961.1 chemotaxis protein MotA [Chitinasiproducens palmae]
MQLILGFLVLLGCIFGGFALHGGSLGVIWQPTEIMIIVGGGLGALVVGNPWHVLKDTLLQLKWVIARRQRDMDFQRELLLLLYELLRTVADGGLRALDQHVEEPHNSALFQKYPKILAEPRLVAFIADNFRLMAMGRITPHELESMLDQELEAMQEAMLHPSRALAKSAEAMPGFGILAAVLGIVLAMSELDADIAQIGIKVGAAMIGTFLGILMCYGILEPLSNAIAGRVRSELSALDCVKVVLCAQLGGKPALLAVDAGRKLIAPEVKPSFAKLESWIAAL